MENLIERSLLVLPIWNGSAENDAIVARFNVDDMLHQERIVDDERRSLRNRILYEKGRM